MWFSEQYPLRLPISPAMMHLLARMDPFLKDLESWIPRLIRLWREDSGRSGHRSPADHLTPEEIRSLVSSLRQLTNAFTSRRNLVRTAYLERPDLLGAYLLYFWPISYIQARYGLQTVERHCHNFRLDRCLDLFCGPGPMSAALFGQGAREVVGADYSEQALSLARQILRDFGPQYTNTRWDARSGMPHHQGPYDLIILGHGLNEMWQEKNNKLSLRADLLRKASTKLTDSGIILVLEPALKSTTRELLAIRDILVNEGFRIIAPCYWQGPCPVLATPETTCHAEYRWRMPQLIRDISQAAGPDRDVLKMSYFAATRAAIDDTPDRYRVISDPLVNKAGRTRLAVCGPTGRITISAKRNEGFPAEDAFFRLRKGDAVRITGLCSRGESWALDESTIIERQ